MSLQTILIAIAVWLLSIMLHFCYMEWGLCGCSATIWFYKNSNEVFCHEIIRLELSKIENQIVTNTRTAPISELNFSHDNSSISYRFLRTFSSESEYNYLFVNVILLFDIYDRLTAQT